MQFIKLDNWSFMFLLEFALTTDIGLDFRFPYAASVATLLCQCSILICISFFMTPQENSQKSIVLVKSVNDSGVVTVVY